MLKDLLNSNNLRHIYTISRWFYKNGVTLVEDSEYDSMEMILQRDDPNFVLLKQHWLDDNEPIDLIEYYELEDELPEVAGFDSLIADRIKEYRRLLVEHGSISIRPVRDYMAAYNWFQGLVGVEITLSAKIDGINTKSIYRKCSLAVTSSRGRMERDLHDFTDAAKLCVGERLDQRLYNNELDSMAMYAEGYVDVEGRQLLKEYVGDYTKFVNAKSSALSMLQVEYPVELYKHLHFCVFKLKGYSDSLRKMFDSLKACGYETPPNITVMYTSKTFEEFCSWLDGHLEWFKQKQDVLGLPMDGVVVEVDNQTEFYLKEASRMYSEGNIALKLGPWIAKGYKGVVRAIDISTRKGTKENYSVRLILDPVRLDTGETVSAVNGFNLGYIQSLGIDEGSTIEFILQSGATAILRGVINE